MAHRVTVEFSTRAVARLEHFPPEVQQFFLKKIAAMQKTIEKHVKAGEGPPPASVIPRTAPIKDARKRYYRTFHARGTNTDYITFKWPYKLPKRPIPDDFTYVLLIASLGNWDERFKEMLQSGDLWR